MPAEKSFLRRAAAGYALAATVLCALVTDGCQFPDGQPMESPQNRAQIVDDGGWRTGALTGEFLQPLYPVKVPYPSFDTTFTALVKGPRYGYATPANRTPERGDLFIYGYLESGTSFSAQNIQFQDDITDLTKRKWQQTGTYKVGLNLGFKYWDVAKATVYFNDTYVGHGRAVLTYRTGSAIVASETGTVLSIGEPVWVQAGADLPTPITFAWTIDGTPLTGTSRSFIDTVYNTVGGREYFVTMTGSNGASVNKSWTIQIVCPDGGFIC
jgi:hypothetical protein